MSQPPDPTVIPLGVSHKTRDALRAMKEESGRTLGQVAAHLLTHSLPLVRDTWEEYVWPPKRRANGAKPPRAIINVPVPRRVYREYQAVANDIALRAIGLGLYCAPIDETDGKHAVASPVEWLMRCAISDQNYRDQIGAPDPAAPRVVATKDTKLSNGPLMLAVLPTRAVLWLDRKRMNRSAFVRAAAETVVPVLAASGTVPPMSRLMPDDTPCRIPVRMSASLHESIKQTARTKGVSMTHLIRAACLQHLAHIATQPKET